MEIIAALPELDQVVHQLLVFANGRKKFLLDAEMGSGKTTFVNVFAAHFQVREQTSSPTFSLINEYSYLKDGQPQLIRHLDLYRLRNLQEAKDIGIEDILDDHHYAFIEWPDVIEPLLYGDEIRIKIETIAENRRKFVFL
jgi:tRNA threonylcarbamoyladenosine biosynthesis protein TsaE